MLTTSVLGEVKASGHTVEYRARGKIRFASGGNACILRAMRTDRQPFSSGCVNYQDLGAAGALGIIITESSILD